MQSTTDDSASGGHFTAAATLTANFDANTETVMAVRFPTKLGVSIGGAITDFMTGDVSRPNWKVTLKCPCYCTVFLSDRSTDATTTVMEDWAVPWMASRDMEC